LEEAIKLLKTRGHFNMAGSLHWQKNIGFISKDNRNNAIAGVDVANE
jgi:hypothetical protein